MDFRAPAEAETIGESPFLKKYKIRDFPGGPLVKNVPCNGGDVGSIFCSCHSIEFAVVKVKQ